MKPVFERPAHIPPSGGFYPSTDAAGNPIEISVEEAWKLGWFDENGDWATVAA